MKNKERNKICVKCGKTFTSLSHLAKYCNECKIIVKREKHRLYTKQVRDKNRLAMNLKCEKCGCDITKFKRVRRFCPECRLLSLSEVAKEYYNSNKEIINIRQKEYYKKPGIKERHRVVARESARRRRIEKKLNV